MSAQQKTNGLSNEDGLYPITRFMIEVEVNDLPFMKLGDPDIIIELKVNTQFVELLENETINRKLPYSQTSLYQDFVSQLTEWYNNTVPTEVASDVSQHLTSKYHINRVAIGVIFEIAKRLGITDKNN